MSFSIFLKTYLKISLPSVNPKADQVYVNFQRLLTSGLTRDELHLFEKKEKFKEYFFEIVPRILIPAANAFIKSEVLSDKKFHRKEELLSTIIHCSMPKNSRFTNDIKIHESTQLNRAYRGSIRNIIENDYKQDMSHYFDFTSEPDLLTAQLGQMATESIYWLYNLQLAREQNITKNELISYFENAISYIEEEPLESEHKNIDLLIHWFKLLDISSLDYKCYQKKLYKYNLDLEKTGGIANTERCNEELYWTARIRGLWIGLNTKWTKLFDVKNIVLNAKVESNPNSADSTESENKLEWSKEEVAILDKFEELNLEDSIEFYEDACEEVESLSDYEKSAVISFEDSADNINQIELYNSCIEPQNLDEPDSITEIATGVISEELTDAQQEYNLIFEFLTFSYENQKVSAEPFWVDLNQIHKDFSSYVLCLYSFVALSVQTDKQINKDLSGLYNVGNIKNILKANYKPTGNEIDKIARLFEELITRLKNDTKVSKYVNFDDEFQSLINQVKNELELLKSKTKHYEPPAVIAHIKRNKSFNNAIKKIAEILDALAHPIRSDERNSYIDLMTSTLSFKLECDSTFGSYLKEVSKKKDKTKILGDPVTNISYKLTSELVIPKKKKFRGFMVILMNHIYQQQTSIESTSFQYEGLKQAYVDWKNDYAHVTNKFNESDVFWSVIDALEHLLLEELDVVEESINNSDGYFMEHVEFILKHLDMLEDDVRNFIIKFTSRFCHICQITAEDRDKGFKDVVKRAVNFLTKVNSGSENANVNTMLHDDWNKLNMSLFGSLSLPENPVQRIFYNYQNVWRRITGSSLTKKEILDSKLSRHYKNIINDIDFEPWIKPLNSLLILADLTEGERNE